MLALSLVRQSYIWERAIFILILYPDLHHWRCNQVYLPWINRGERKTASKHYNTRKQSTSHCAGLNRLSSVSLGRAMACETLPTTV